MISSHTPQKIRVGVFCKPLEKPFSGSGSHLKGLLTELTDTVFEDIEFVLLTSKPESVKNFGFKVVQLSNNYFENYLTISALNLSILHFHPFTIKSFFWLTKVKKVATIHGASRITMRSTYGWLHWIHAKFLRPFAQFFLDAIVTSSNASKRQLMDGALIGTVEPTIIYIGVNSYLAYPPGTKPLGLDSRSYIFHMSNFSLRKNPFGILDGYKESVRLGVDKNLVIAGKGWNNLVVQDWLSKNPKLQDRISILDFVCDSEVRDLYDHAAVFLFPSFYEGFGMPIIEAMSCGAPVVTSKIGAMIEVGGDAAVFVSDPKSTNEIGMSIAGILSDVEQWNDISARGLKHANAFSWKSAAEKHLDLYRNLMV